MRGGRQEWVPYPSLNTTIRLSHPGTRNVGMNGNPSARENCSKTTPHYIPDRPAVPEVGTTIGAKRAGVKRWNGARIDRGSLKQVVDEEEKQHYKGQGIG